MDKRVGITFLIIFASACLLIDLVALAGVGVFLWDKNNPQPTITAAPTLAIVPDITGCPEGGCQTPTIEATKAALPTADLPKYITKAMDQIQSEVIEIRGLQPRVDIPRALLTPQQLRQKVIEDFLAEYTQEDANNDVILLSLLGLLPQDFDLMTFYEELYNEQIAGYYDDETKEMYVVSGSGFAGPEKMTFAHEFTHILQDQNYDFENGLRINDTACEDDSERCAAIKALIEGDASFTEYFWYFQYATEQDQAEVQSFYEVYQSPVYDSAPEFMKSDFLFPYSSGQEFVQVLYDQGGWQAINNAFVNPPLSTEQIMHPSRYPGDAPVKIDLPDMASALGEGWKLLESDVVGEWYTYLILSKGIDPNIRLDDTDALTAAEGWGGDAFQVYHNSNNGQRAFVVKSIWDTSRDAKEFYGACQTYGKARWGLPSSQNSMETGWLSDKQSVTIQVAAPITLLVIAPDAITRDMLIQILAGE